MQDGTEKQTKDKKAEPAVAKISKILERRLEKVKNRSVVVAFGAKPSDEGDAHATCKSLINL